MEIEGGISFGVLLIVNTFYLKLYEKEIGLFLSHYELF